ncbi:MAG: hypothetical protein ABSE58_01165 [Candidatus Limnocylindrales bacterium]
MTSATNPPVQRIWHRLGRGDALFCVAVILVYAAATAASVYWRHLPTDRMMTLAASVLNGRLDSDSFRGTVDSVDIGGRYYIAVGPLQLLPYLPFAFLSALQSQAGHIVGVAVGIPAAILALPLARAYGARGSLAYWVAGFTAFGTLLFYVSVFGDFYYLAHAESFLALTVFLIEWAGRRRPGVLGACMAVAFLTRPTTALAAVPFGIALLWQKRDARRSLAMTAAAFAAPLGVALAIYGWFNWVRFGSPLQAGYTISYLAQQDLLARRALGLFSVLQIPENFRLAVLAPFKTMPGFPFLTANPYGLSMLLVSPALLTALWAGFKERTARLLWIATALVAVPVFLYYGGGYIQYGFRYSLDFTPFLIALIAMGSSRWAAYWNGRLERLLILFSMVSVTYGILWHNIPRLQP